MKLSRILLFLGVAANAFTVLLALAMGHAPGMQGSGTLFVIVFFPVIWGMTFILAIVFVFAFRKTLPDSTGLRFLGFFLCTPILLISVLSGYEAMKEDVPVVYEPLTSVEYWNGVAYKYDEKVNYEGADHVATRYIADSLELVTKGDAAYRKDSVWIYYKGYFVDTLKIEYYKNDSLIRTVDMSRK